MLVVAARVIHVPFESESTEGPHTNSNNQNSIDDRTTHTSRNNNSSDNQHILNTKYNTQQTINLNASTARISTWEDKKNRSQLNAAACRSFIVSNRIAFFCCCLNCTHFACLFLWSCYVNREQLGIRSCKCANEQLHFEGRARESRNGHYGPWGLGRQ